VKTQVRRRVRSGLMSVVAALLIGILAGCSTAGSAAVVGSERITEQELSEQVSQVLRVQGRPLDSNDPELAREVLNRLVITSLVEQLAEREGVTVTQGDIDQTILNFESQVGGPQALVDVYAEQGVAPEQIPATIRLNALATELSTALDPTGTPETQSQALVQAVMDLGLELGTEVSPRWGSWQSMMLTIGPVTDDLSIPSALS
jgi:hypothetical protein